MRRAAFLLIGAGCNQIYGLDPTTVRDLEPPACSTVQFGSPAKLAQFDNGDREGEPQLSSDGTELWYTSNTVGTNSKYLIFRGVRAADTGPFDVELVELVDNDIGNGNPALTADGRRLMFSFGDEVYEGIRQDPHAFPFDSVVAVNGFGQHDKGVQELDLSWDGLRIYYVANKALWFARRKDRDQPFIEHRMLLDAGAEIGSLTVSGDELEMFYSRANVPDEEPPLYRRERASLTETFGPAQLVLDEGLGPDIAPTSSKMIVGRDATLVELTRRCEED